MKNDEYVLGVQDEEVERLGIQHQVWRPMMLYCWKRAGLLPGHKALDVGAGPGFATVDLAQFVGESGRVDAVERSQKFCAIGSKRCTDLGKTNVTFHNRDLIDDPLPGSDYDFAWCRWVFAFMNDPRHVVEKVCTSLKPGGIFAIYEYVQYDTWRCIPERPMISEFVGIVMKQWRDAGGEPDIARELPQLLGDMGMKIEYTEPIVFRMTPANFSWNWPAKFIRNQTLALVEQGLMSQDQCELILIQLEEAERDPNSLMISPLVLEIVARKL